MNTWTDYNDADDQSSFDLIPKGTLVKVRMTIRPGGYDDPHEGWTGGYATRNERTGSVYLNCEFVVLEGANDKHVVKIAIGPDHKDYAALMGTPRPVASPAPPTSQQGPSRGPLPTRPSWAQ